MTSALVVQFGQLSYYQPGAGHVVSSYYTHRWWENAKKNIYLNCEERCNSSWETNEKIKFGLERDSNPWPLRYRKTGISLLQSPTKVLARLPTFAASVSETYQLTRSPRFNVVYRDEFVIARFQHCLGEGGGGSLFQWCHYWLFPKYACQRIFVLSLSGVPRTSVVRRGL